MTVLDLPLTLDDRPLPRRVGLVTLATDHTTEVDFAALPPRGIGVYAMRIPFANPVTPDTLAAMAGAEILDPEFVQFHPTAIACGADPAPFFRVFNPVLQGRKFDPDGSYVRRYVPELERLPDRYVHEPWSAPAEVLAKAGVTLGRTYPKPIVDHGAARDRALEAFRAVKAAGKAAPPG